MAVVPCSEIKQLPASPASLSFPPLLLLVLSALPVALWAREEPHYSFSFSFSLFI